MNNKMKYNVLTRKLQKKGKIMLAKKIYMLAICVMVALVSFSQVACNKNEAEETKPPQTIPPGATPPPGFATPPPVPEVRAKVNGDTIMSTELEKFVNRRIMIIANQGYRRQLDPDQVVLIRRQMLEGLVNGLLLAQEAEKQGHKVSDEELTKSLDHIIQQSGGEQNFNIQLKQMGSNMDELKASITKDMMAKKLEKKLTEKLKVSNKEVKKYYKDEDGLSLKARHILIKVPEGVPENEENNALEKAREIEKRARSGEDFAKLATETTEDDGTRTTGGDLGYFTRGRMVKPFEDAVFALKVGKITKPVRSTFGYHIIKLVDRKQEHKKPFKEAKEELKTFLLNRKKAVLMGEYMEGLREKSEIELFLE